MSRLSYILVLGTSVGVLTSCNPQPFLSEQREPLALEKIDESKKGSKIKRKFSDSELPVAPASPEPPAVLPAEDVGLYLKVSDLQTNLSVADLQRIRHIAASNERSPLNRGILVIAALRAYAKSGVDSVLFEQAQLTERMPVDVKDWTKAKSLEDLSDQLKISFKVELETNPFVQDLSIYDLALRALEREDKKSEYAHPLRVLLLEKAAQWAKVRERLSPTPVVVEEKKAAVLAPLPASVDPNAPQQTPPPPVSAAVVPTPDLASPHVEETDTDGSGLLKKAQELSEKNEFHNAIEVLRHIEPSSPFHASAAAKIRVVANKAVSELRTKAARAYQSSVPVSDLKARGAYLEQAQKFLQAAIDKYPESDQLSSVRQNLAVIQKSLDVINKERGR